MTTNTIPALHLEILRAVSRGKRHRNYFKTGFTESSKPAEVALALDDLRDDELIRHDIMGNVFITDEGTKRLVQVTPARTYVSVEGWKPKPWPVRAGGEEHKQFTSGGYLSAGKRVAA